MWANSEVSHSPECNQGKMRTGSNREHKVLNIIIKKCTTKISAWIQSSFRSMRVGPQKNFKLSSLHFHLSTHPLP